METKERYCYVCGYDFSQNSSDCEVKRFTLCDCCGFHYGIEDFGENSYLEARQEWISEGV